MPSPQKVRLSLAMMVRDEEELLPGALESVEHVVDEMIVVDTGSVDSTVEIAKGHGAKVSHFEWCDDFSAARNVTLERCTGDWILVLDADERVHGENASRLAESLPAADKYPFQVFMVDVLNTTVAGVPISSAYNVRIVPNDRRLGYRRRVHNDFCALDPNYPDINASLLDGVQIRHLGYDPDIYRKRLKAARSLPLLVASVEDDPHNASQRYYLGREYLRVDRPQDALTHLQVALQLLESSSDHERAMLHEAALRDTIEAQRAAEVALPKILETAVRALENYPRNADLWYVTARTLDTAGAPRPQLAKAVEYYEKALSCPPPDIHGGATWSSIGHRKYIVLERLGQCLAELGQGALAHDVLTLSVEQRPANSPVGVDVLNVLCALSIDLRRDEAIQTWAKALCARPDAPLDMVKIAIADIGHRRGSDVASEWSRTLKSTYPRAHAEL